MQRFAYRLYKPRRLRPGSKYPIIVWTAGYGERGNDNVGQLMHLDHLFANSRRLDECSFFVLAMQNPPGYSRWVQQPGQLLDDDPAKIQMEILDELIKNEPIDVRRIYLAGVSEGGTACWELAMLFPDRFAAVAPMASSGTSASDERIRKLVQIPIWAFHCTDDPTTPPDGVRNTVNRLTKLGSNTALTEVPKHSHDCWTSAFRDYDLGAWLLSHELGGKAGYPPGVRPWKWYHVSLVPAALSAIAIACLIGRKRRSRV